MYFDAKSADIKCHEMFTFYSISHPGFHGQKQKNFHLLAAILEQIIIVRSFTTIVVGTCAYRHIYIHIQIDCMMCECE